MFTWNRADELVVKVKDGSGKIVYKSVVNINDTKRIADIFLLLEKYGTDLDELYEEIRIRKNDLNKYIFEPKDNRPFFI